MKQDSADTFVFAPFMFTQIESLKSDAAKLILYRAVCQYGCYGSVNFDNEADITGIDPTGALMAILQGFQTAIDKAKAMRKRNQENGKRSKGAPKGSRNNPNGRRGKTEELTQTNQELTQTNQELSYNDYMINDYMISDLTEFGSTSVEPRRQEADAPAAQCSNLVFSVDEFLRAWACMPKEYQPRNTNLEKYITTDRKEKIESFLVKVCNKKTKSKAYEIVNTILSNYANGTFAKPRGESHLDYFLKSYCWYLPKA